MRSIDVARDRGEIAITEENLFYGRVLVSGQVFLQSAGFPDPDRPFLTRDDDIAIEDEMFVRAGLVDMAHYVGWLVRPFMSIDKAKAKTSRMASFSRVVATLVGAPGQRKLLTFWFAPYLRVDMTAPSVGDSMQVDGWQVSFGFFSDTFEPTADQKALAQQFSHQVVGVLQASLVALSSLRVEQEQSPDAGEAAADRAKQPGPLAEWKQEASSSLLNSLSLLTGVEERDQADTERARTTVSEERVHDEAGSAEYEEGGDFGGE